MPKVVYANILWFMVVMIAAISESMSRHASDEWASMVNLVLLLKIQAGVKALDIFLYVHTMYI